MTNATSTASLIFGLNDRLFINALDGLTEHQARERLSDHNNPIIWIAAHTIWARYLALVCLGKPAKNPFEGLFENFRPYNAADHLPSLERVKAEWSKSADLLKEAFQSVTPEQLSAETPFKNPIGDQTNKGTIAFLAQHESYDIGQIAFLKKYYTQKAMQYN